jgi:anti-sigma B factor antagonist
MNGRGFTVIHRARGSDSGPAGPERDGAAAAAGRLPAAGAGGNAARAAASECAPAISLGLTHRIYPDGQAVAVITGELDAATADRAQEYVRQVIDRSRGPIRIELAGLSFCDARGLRTLVGAAAYARAAGRRLSLVAPRPAIVKIMRITGADANFPELAQPSFPITRL